MRTVHGGPLTVLPGVAAVLGAARAPRSAWACPRSATGAVLTVVLWLLLEHGMRREGLARLGPANAVTLVRAALVVAVAALVVQSWSTDVPRSLIVALSAVALALDLVDGRLARARGTVTALGAAFDMETDAFLILVLSVYVVPIAGAWVLLIGLARYLLLLAGAVWPWLGGPLPPRPWAQGRGRRPGHRPAWWPRPRCCRRRGPRPCCSRPWCCSLESFGRQVVALWRHRHEQPVPRSPLVRPVLDAVALTVVWLALALPQRPDAADRRRAARHPGRAAGLPGARARAAAASGRVLAGARRRAAGRRRSS